MPPPELFHRHQTALLWPFAGRDAYGEPIRGSMVVLSPSNDTGVRWETGGFGMTGGRGDMEVVDERGNTVALDAIVVVDRDIEVGSLMWLGTEEEWLGHGTGSGSADTASELMEVKVFSSIPDLKNKFNRKVVGLMKFRSGLP